MRKVYLEVEATVLVPVRVKVNLIVRADDDARLDRVVQQWAKRQKTSKADVEEAELDAILKIEDFTPSQGKNFTDPDDFQEALTEAVGGAMDYGKQPMDYGKQPIQIHFSNVTDSK